MNTPPRMTRAEIGALGEQLAVDHLISLGMTVLVRNWRCRWGELDIIATERDRSAVVFVGEDPHHGRVRWHRGSRDAGKRPGACAGLASLWLAEQDARWHDIRIDVIGVRLGGRQPELVHLKGIG